MQVARRTRIQWHDDEIEQVALQMNALLREHPSWPVGRLLQHAQVVLPAARQRPKTCLSPSINPRVVKAAELLRRVNTPVVEAEPVVVPGRIVEIEVPVVPEASVVLAETPTGLLVACLWARGAAWLDGWLKAAYTHQGKALPASHGVVPAPRYPAIPIPKRPQLPKYAVVGLWKEQFEFAAKEVREKAELMFVDRESDKPEFPLRVDGVILVTTGIRHHWFHGAKAQFPKERVHLVEGNFRAVVQKVFDLLSLQPK